MEHECVDAVLAPDFDNLAAVLPTRWLYGKDHSGFLARSRPGGICALDYRAPRPVRTKDKAMMEYPVVVTDKMNTHDSRLQLLCGPLGGDVFLQR